MDYFPHGFICSIVQNIDHESLRNTNLIVWTERHYMKTEKSAGVTILTFLLAVIFISNLGADIVCGDTNNDLSVNVSDAVHTINYVFSGVDQADPLCKGDVNTDDRVNISDAVYLINYVFSEGDDPDCPPDCAGSTFTLTYPIVETGLTDCYDNLAIITCPLADQDFYGQDASHPGTVRS